MPANRDQPKPKLPCFPLSRVYAERSLQVSGLGRAEQHPAPAGERSGGKAQPAQGQVSVTGWPTAARRHRSASEALTLASPFVSHTHSGAHVREPTAVPRMNRQSLALGTGPVVIGKEQPTCSASVVDVDGAVVDVEPEQGVIEGESW